MCIFGCWERGHPEFGMTLLLLEIHSGCLVSGPMSLRHVRRKLVHETADRATQQIVSTLESPSVNLLVAGERTRLVNQYIRTGVCRHGVGGMLSQRRP